MSAIPPDDMRATARRVIDERIAAALEALAMPSVEDWRRARALLRKVLAEERTAQTRDRGRRERRSDQQFRLETDQPAA